MEMERIESIVKSQLSEKRFNHVKNVANEAVRIASKYYVDTEKAYIAGFLHDVTKEFTKEAHFQLFNEAKLKLDPIEERLEKIWHSISGAIYAEKVLGIDDKEILNAITYHQLGRANMSKLEKIIFISDYTSCERNFEGVDKIRDAVNRSLDDGVIEKMKFTLYKLINLECPISGRGLDTYNYYVALKKWGEKI